VLFYRPRGPVSVRQTIVADRVPQQTPVGVSRTTTTDPVMTLAPIVASQTTVTERTNVETPASL